MQQRVTRFVSAAAIVGVAVLGGCATSRVPQTRVDTHFLASELEAALSRDAHLARATSVAVDPKTGIVTLAGRVESAEDRENAGRLACAVKGVKVVYNVIQVQHGAR